MPKFWGRSDSCKDNNLLQVAYLKAFGGGVLSCKRKRLLRVTGNCTASKMEWRKGYVFRWQPFTVDVV